MSEAEFHFEVESSTEEGIKKTTIICHGRLVAGIAGEIRDVVKPLIPQGGEIVIDLGDVQFLDSMGLGALVGLKVSALNEGYCVLKLENLTPRLQDLLTMTNLKSLFAS